MLKVFADIMHLTRKQRDKLLITKNGLAFLQNLTPVDQYKQLIDHYWHRVNWPYFSASGWTRDDRAKLCETLQRNQNHIWNILAANGTSWVDYKGFCEVLRDELNLQSFLKEHYSTSDEALERSIHNMLFTDNLSLFCCVEVETKPGKYDWDVSIVRFRSTKLGLAMYQGQ